MPQSCPGRKDLLRHHVQDTQCSFKDYFYGISALYARLHWKEAERMDKKKCNIATKGFRWISKPIILYHFIFFSELEVKRIKVNFSWPFQWLNTLGEYGYALRFNGGKKWICLFNIKGWSASYTSLVFDIFQVCFESTSTILPCLP